MNYRDPTELLAELQELPPPHPSAPEQVFFALRDLRLEEKLTQSDLAKLVDMRQKDISRLESKRANPTVKLLEKIAEAGRRQLVIRFEKK